MLWLWCKGKLWPVRYLAVIILIAGPLYQLTAPTVETLQRHDLLQSQIVILQAEVDQLTASLKRYENNSATRYGWKGSIDNIASALPSARENLLMAEEALSILGPMWRHYIVTVMMLAVLIIVMIAQINAVTDMRNGTITKTVTETVMACNGVTEAVTKQVRPETIQQRPDDFESYVTAVSEEIKKRTPEFGSWAKLAKHYGIRPADITAVMNHGERIRVGGEVVSVNGLRKMLLAFGIEGIF